MRMAQKVGLCGLVALLLLLLVQHADSKRRRMRPKEAELLEETPVRKPLQPAPPASSGLEDGESLLKGCGRLFIDGGSNTGESVRAFLGGGMFTCALHSPTRQYSSRWNSLSRRERATIMQPLKEPSSFCIRSFEAVPELAVGLRAQETKLRAGGADVRFIDGMLSNKSAVDAPRTIVKYAENAWGSSAVGLDFGDVHVGGKPVPLSTRVARGKSYDLHALLSTAVRLNSSAVIALKLDVEGSEWWLLEKLVADTRLLCSISYIFAEFHSTASAQQRERLATYGLESELFEGLKKRVHAAMESPTCKLQIYWRSFWASCGDKQRFEWRTSGQATAASFEPEDSKGRPV